MNFAVAWHAVVSVWTFVLAVIDGQPIRVGTLLSAILLSVVGYHLSGRASRWFRILLETRLHVEEAQAATFETLGFYTLFAAVLVTGLRLVNFPLTVFTFVGGALAIGIGFGSQNVMNNFISGIILMLERPVRGGDLVEVEGTHGHVEHIGPRSTVVRASDNTQIIVPNSFFLQNNVVNFTLSDDVLRSKVAVGVAYGSPTRRVTDLLTQVLREEPGVLDQPAPRVVFADFGDNALIFEAYFWLRARSILDRRAIESEVRHRIGEHLDDAGIVIAFPQRDVHLDTTRPLAVEVVTQSVPK